MDSRQELSAEEKITYLLTFANDFLSNHEILAKPNNSLFSFLSFFTANTSHLTDEAFQHLNFIKNQFNLAMKEVISTQLIMIGGRHARLPEELKTVPFSKDDIALLEKIAALTQTDANNEFSKYLTIIKSPLWQKYNDTSAAATLSS